MLLSHPLSPVLDRESRILILGSFPSVKSREAGFYYGHPRNRFWPLMEALFSVKLVTTEDKEDFLHSHHIAMSDVILSCEIKASDDSSIKDVVPNDIEKLIEGTSVSKIFLNGGKAYELYTRNNKIDIPAIRLPSTSPANAAWSFSRLLSAWEIIRTSLEE